MQGSGMERKKYYREKERAFIPEFMEYFPTLTPSVSRWNHLMFFFFFFLAVKRLIPEQILVNLRMQKKKKNSVHAWILLHLTLYCGAPVLVFVSS